MNHLNQSKRYSDEISGFKVSKFKIASSRGINKISIELYAPYVQKIILLQVGRVLYVSFQYQENRK